MIKTVSILAATLAVSGVAFAAPDTGRRENPDLKISEVGVFGVAGDNKAAGSVGKFATAQEKAILKEMGDTLLRQEFGAYKIGLTEFRWNIQGKSDRLLTNIMWIDGDYVGDDAVNGINLDVARISYCRVIGVAQMGDTKFDIAELQKIYDQTVQTGVPHHTQAMRNRGIWAEALWSFCKRNDGRSWAVIRGGNGIGGKSEWVYLGEYTPGDTVSGRVQWADIPNHRRNDEALGFMRLGAFRPVNKYDAALMPTPGDVDGMKDIDPDTREK
jgi:hypothetical protein